MTGEWAKAYDLSEDMGTIESIQRATLKSGPFGLIPDVALFGSIEWWKAIDDGRILKQEIRGTISRLYMTGHGDWPEFEIDSEGTKTKWTRFGNQDLYREGREVRLEYVEQRAKKAWLGTDIHKKIIRIFLRIEQGFERGNSE